jgi:hypothetical protein
MPGQRKSAASSNVRFPVREGCAGVRSEPRRRRSLVAWTPVGRICSGCVREIEPLFREKLRIAVLR